ncbi:MAG: Rrf2 family transcriptional regulator [Phycisphaerales bacterium]
MLTQAVGYAATALAQVASGGGKPVLVKEIAQASGIPAPYLAKIVQTLARKGIVITQRGIGGGVTLAKDPKTVTLHDVCVALDDPSVQHRCMLGTAECSDDRACPCHKFWSIHRSEFLDFLKGTTVADMALFEARRRWKGKPGDLSAMLGSVSKHAV